MQTTGITTNDRANRAHTPTSSKVDGGMDRFYGPLEIRLTADGTRFWRREEGGSEVAPLRRGAFAFRGVVSESG